MSIGKVVYMNVITYAGSVGSVIVIPVDIYAVTLSDSRIQYQWYQMGFRVMQFTDFTVKVTS